MTLVLIVDDEPLVRRSLADALKRSGLETVGAPSGESGLRIAEEQRPDLILLDFMLEPSMSGIDFCKRLRDTRSIAHTPVIALTGTPVSWAESALFDAGVDDFVRKADLRPDVLVQRIQAILRRVAAPSADVLRVGALEFHTTFRRVTVDGEQLSLRPKEYDILLRLARAADEPVERSALLDRDEPPGRQTSVSVHILAIRRSLGTLAWMVETVRGRGYVLRSHRDEPRA